VFAEPLSILIAQQMVHSEALSALPNAPVRDDSSRIGSATRQTRLRLASSLRTAAARIEPQVGANPRHAA
jgi:hypothetical protein